MRRQIIVMGIILTIASLSWLALKPGGDLTRYQNYYVAEKPSRLPNQLCITFLGASSLLLDDGETQLMIDGFFSRYPLWQVALTPLTTNAAAVDHVLQRLQVNRLQGLFVSHSHYDHAFDSAYIAKHTGAMLYGSESMLNIGKGAGLPDSRMQLYHPAEELKIGKFSITVFPSAHTAPLFAVNNDIGEHISAPLSQPARYFRYKEGGSYDFLIRHGAQRIFIKPDANYLPGALDHVKADILFLGIATLGHQSESFQQAFYSETVSKLSPRLLIPIHWDNFFEPLTPKLTALPWLIDDLDLSLDFLIHRTAADHIQFQIVQGYQSLVVDSSGLPATDLRAAGEH